MLPNKITVCKAELPIYSYINKGEEMAHSNYQSFFEGDCFAVVGNSQKKEYPILTLNGLKKSGKKVYKVDSITDSNSEDKVYQSLDQLPGDVDRVIIEVPKEESASWVVQVKEKGIKDVWLHMNCDSDEAKELAKKNGINLRYGTCAVMYVTPGLTYHSIHKWIMKAIGKF